MCVSTFTPGSCIIIVVLSSQAYVYAAPYAWETLVTRLGDDAIIRKVRIGGCRANDDEHIIIACATRRRYSPRKRRGHPTLHVTLCAHTRISSPLLSPRDPPSFDRHNLSLHTGKDALDKSTPCSTALPLIYAVWRCSTAVKGDLSRERPSPCHGIRNQPSRVRARRTDQRKKMSTLHFVRDPFRF